MTFAVNVNGGGTRRLKARAPIVQCGEQFIKIHHNRKYPRLLYINLNTAISIFFLIMESFLFRQKLWLST